MQNNKALLTFIFLFVSLIKLITATDLNLIHPDEHYQALEPAFHALTEKGLLSWEWKVGYRPWTVPGVYIPFLWAWSKFYTISGAIPIILCRIVSALFAIVMSYCTMLLTRTLLKNKSYEILFLILMSASGFILSLSVSTHSENLAASIYWIALSLVLIKSDKSPHYNITTGILFGLSVALRFQMLAIVVPTYMLLVLNKFTQGSSSKDTKGLFSYNTLGLALAILSLGMLDYVTFNEIFHSWKLHYNYNFVQKISHQYGVSPWYEYFKYLYKADGLWICISFALALIVAPVLSLYNRDRRALIALAPSSLYLIVHLMLGHKELRFLYPVWPAVIIGVLMLINSAVILFSKRLQNTLLDQVSTWSILIPTALCIAIGFWTSRQRHIVSSFDLSAVSQKAYEDGELFNSNKNCIVLFEHYWSWTRGNMFWGKRVDLVEANSKNILNHINQCPYVFVAAHAFRKFKPIASSNDLRLLYTDRWHNSLYKKTKTK